jgi:hypothetical protein
MLIITGIFKNEKFIPDRPVSIPQNKKVTITIDEGLPADIDRRAAKRVARRATFDKCRLDLSSFKFNRNEANDYEEILTFFY